MKKFTCALLLLVTSFSISFFAQTKKRPRVKPAILVAPKTPEKSEKTEQPKTLGVTIEKYVANHDVNADGTAVETFEILQRFTSAVAIERLKNFERTFNGNLQKAEVLEAYILKADGQKVGLAETAVQITPTAQAEAAPSFSSDKQIKILFEDVKPGDATYLKVRLTTVKPYFENHFDTLELFPVIYEWKSVEINLSAPKDFPLYLQAIDLEGGKIADENGRARWQWRRQNLAAIEVEFGMFDIFGSGPRLVVSSFKNFDELGAAYWEQARKKAIVTPEIQTLADEITKDLKEPPRQAAAIYQWVNKNIRYLSIVLERGGWIPHSTTEILANRYGDCKDYSILIYALLKAKNIESYPVLIRAEMGDWFPDVAAPDYFNHAILYLPELKVFADATAPNTRLGLIPPQIVGKKAILAGEKTGLIQTPKDRPEDNQLLSDIEIKFAPDGSLKAFSKNIYDGRTEIIFRPLFADSVIQQNSDNFVKTLLTYFGVNGTGKLVNIGNPFNVGEPFRVELEIELPNFTTFMPKGSFPLPVALNLMNTLELEQFVKAEKRRTNLILGATRFRENFKLILPEGVKLAALPATISFKNAVGSYRNEFSLEPGGAIKVVRELVIDKDVISAPDYPLIRELIKQSVEGFNAEITYTANPALVREKSRELRKNPVKKPKPTSFSELTISDLMSDEKKLTRAEAVRAEAKLKKNPGDVETRKQLLRFYSNYEVEDTPGRIKARLGHRLWFVQNRPEMEEMAIYGFKTPVDSPAEFETLRSEWLKQVQTNNTNPRIRLNAVNFLRSIDPQTSEKLLAEGREIDRENFEFPLILSEMAAAEIEKPAQSEEARAKRAELLGKAFENGETALVLLKKERSSERDSKRGKLLQSLAKIAFELKKYDRAKAFSTELILDFGQDSKAGDFEEATHIGNIVLGQIALQEGETAKAKEYLLIAIRAPLRKEGNHLTEIDTALARELFAKDEKETVLEYLKLCENLSNLKKYTTLYADEIKALKLWQEQIRQGKTPSFDFEAP